MKDDKDMSSSIVKLIDAFKPINPVYKKWYGNKTQRKAAQSIIEDHGEETALKVIAILPKTNEMTYMPTIMTLLQLEEKWSTLENALKKAKTSKKINNNIAF